jgi:hypothetical protein
VQQWEPLHPTVAQQRYPGPIVAKNKADGLFHKVLFVHARAEGIQPTARGTDVAHSTSSCGPFNVSVTYNQGRS